MFGGETEREDVPVPSSQGSIDGDSFQGLNSYHQGEKQLCAKYFFCGNLLQIYSKILLDQQYYFSFPPPTVTEAFPSLFYPAQFMYQLQLTQYHVCALVLRAPHVYLDLISDNQPVEPVQKEWNFSNLFNYDEVWF